MNIREAALATATFKALSDLVKEKDACVRQQMLETLLKSYDEMGIKSLDVKLPDGTKVASLSLTIPKGKGAVVTDSKAFFDWVNENYPSTIYTPAKPQPVITPAWAEKFLAGLEPAGTDAIDRTTGEIVPGVEIADAPQPKSFSVRFVDDGRDNVIDAFKQSLAQGDDLLSLPAADELPEGD